jgi:hypothetical protein
MSPGRKLATLSAVRIAECRKISRICCHMSNPLGG